MEKNGTVYFSHTGKNKLQMNQGFHHKTLSPKIVIEKRREYTTSYSNRQ